MIIKAKIVINSENVVKGRAAESIGTAVATKSTVPFWKHHITDLKSQGTPKQNRISNMLDPIELQIAISA